MNRKHNQMMTRRMSLLLLVSWSVITIQRVDSFTQNPQVARFALVPPTPTSSSPVGKHSKQSGVLSSSSLVSTTKRYQRISTLYSSFYADDDDIEEEDDDDDDDDDDFIDMESLGDWRKFRMNLSMDEQEQQIEGKSNDPSSTSSSATTTTSSSSTKTRGPKSVSKENEEILMRQNKELAEEYITGVWAHEVATPEVGGLVARMPLESELFHNFKHSIFGKRFRRQLENDTNNDDDDGNNNTNDVTKDVGVWYARAKTFIENEMKRIATLADEEGQIDATKLDERASEMLTLFLDNQENWQEVCLVLEQEGSKTKTVVLNRPMAFKLTDNIARLVLNGAFQDTTASSSSAAAASTSRKDLVRFMTAFASECAVYVGGPDEQNKPAIMVHGIPNLPGSTEISPGSKIYQGGIDAAVQGVLDGTYSPLEFRFFVGCHAYEEAALEVAVHLGKYKPIACARTVALKQCISLPKPLWHEVMELCGGELQDLSSLEQLNDGELQFQVVDETGFDDDDDDDDEIPDELGELENFEDDDDDQYL